MIKIDRAVIVEGRYDKIKLFSVIDGIIIETDGFGIFNDKEKQRLIRRLAEAKGLLILTDSDSAGFKIRSFIRGIVPSEQIKHAYIPDIFGKERDSTTSGSWSYPETVNDLGTASPSTVKSSTVSLATGTKRA